MTIVVSLFGVFIVGMCVWGFIMPQAMMKTVLKAWNHPSGIYLAIAVRIALGVIFILVASESRYPDLFTFFGYLMIIAAVLIAVIGRKRLDRFVRWWVDGSPLLVRALLVLGALFGAFIIYAVN